ncbi:unnamed protein product [Calypogeia fissa]
MDRIWDLYSSAKTLLSEHHHHHRLHLPRHRKIVPSKSSSTTRELTRINDYVFEVYAPKGRPTVEIVFFHGLQLEDPDLAHITTWKSEDGSELWLDWISQKFPDSRLLTISYDAHTKRTDEQGTMDMPQTRENLVKSVTEMSANVGQDGCPVILVGHCLGGLVMKELCLQAHETLTFSFGHKSAIPAKNFLNQVKGLFFFASPHHGTVLADQSKEPNMSSLFKGVTIHNAELARRNEFFRKLRSHRRWHTFVIMAGSPVHLESFKGIVVPEASARHDVDAGSFYIVQQADHFNVCRPKNRESSSFQILSGFVADVVKEDQSQPGPKMSIPDPVVGLQDQVMEVQRKLENAPRVGIIGRGGIGKTTLAKILYNTISWRFEFTCFLEEVNQSFATKEHPERLRAKVIKDLYFKGRKVQDDFSWEELRGRSVLIVLDNVEHESHFQVMTESDWFSGESRVIVTCHKNNHILISEDFKLYRVTELTPYHSETLLCLHAFKTPTVKDGFKDHVRRMSKKCGGYPLALSVYGKYLRNRSIDIWDLALTKIGRVESLNGTTEDKDELVSTLAWSYDSLGESEKKMFLDVAIFFHGERLTKARKVWRMCGWEVYELTWRNLVDRGLVKQAVVPHPEDFLDFEVQDRDFEDYYVIQMHELLRDLGLRRYKAATQLVPDQTGVCDKIYKQGNPKVGVLKLDREKIDLSRLPGLQNLRILSLDGGTLEGDLHLLPPRLVYLKIMNMRKWISSTVNLSSLHKLEEHRNLQYLEIERCHDLETLPNSIRQLSGVTDLTICKCSKLKDLSSLLHLHALQNLTISECPSIEILPDLLKMLQALKYLRIHSCHGLKGLPDSLRQVIKPSREPLGQLQGLENLVIQEAIWQLPDLKHLAIMYHNPSDFDSFTLGLLRALEYLKISEDHSVKADPKLQIGESLGELQALKQLWFWETRKLAALPQKLGCLQALKVLWLEECWKLRSLPNSFGELQALKILHIGADKLTDLPGLGQLRALEVLRLERCEALTSLPDLGELQALKSLHIRATWLDTFPDTLKKLKALEYLHIQDNHMPSLPDIFGEFDNLKRLELVEFKRLRYLPDSLGQLTSLQHLKLDGFRLLLCLPESLGDLPSLNELEVSECPHLRALPSKVVELKTLQHLKIRNCPKLQYDEGSINKKFRRWNSLNHRADVDNWYRLEVQSDADWK